jgi:adenosine kinase
VRVAVTGSVATDHLMTFPGRFADQLLAGEADHLSLSFLVDDLVTRRGGVAANISYGMAVLGLRPALVAAVGRDFDEYGRWLAARGVRLAVHVAERAGTARFFVTTDRDNNQLASFYPGAMTEAAGMTLGPAADLLGGLDLVVVSPNAPEAMLRHTDECRDRGLPFAADPSQQLARLDGPEIRRLAEGAAYLFGNEYEIALLLEKAGWTAAQLADAVGVQITTLGEHGVRVSDGTGELARVPAVPARQVVVPPGAGDAFRAGYLTGRCRGLGHRRAAELGCLLATAALEVPGPQDYGLPAGAVRERLAGAYGPAAAAETTAALAAAGGGPAAG